MKKRKLPLSPPTAITVYVRKENISMADYIEEWEEKLEDDCLTCQDKNGIRIAYRKLKKCKHMPYKESMLKRLETLLVHSGAMEELTNES